MAGLKFIALMGLAILLTGCSKTVQWEEEVPLNTGETIWVKRSVVYSLQGESGNPLNIGYAPNKTEQLSFEWSGKKYAYAGDAALMLLAISPQKEPVLVAPAGDRNWDWNHKFFCTVPFYVQFVPNASNREWTWLPDVEPWLFGLSHNLMRQRRKPEEMKSRYSTQQRSDEDATMAIQSPTRAKIDSNHSVRDCKKRN